MVFCETVTSLRGIWEGIWHANRKTDIDDTIKISHVRDRLSLLRHTFALPPSVVSSMPRLYAQLNSVLRPAWYYLSASPYNLFPMLREFLAEHYPQGQILLREMSWQELESFILSLTVGTQKYKERELARLVKQLPQRKWVLIGDSTQKDPEAYATAYKANPEKVRRIWIRVVEGVNETEEKRLNSEERFRAAFKGVPKEVWRTFREASELEALVGDIS
jgi:phosphatidate phosphatase APP1